MRISESCAQCLYDKQKKRCPDPEYLRKVKELLDQRGEEETSPYMVYRFNLIHEQMFGREPGYQQEKKRYNDLVLGMEKDLRLRIEQEEDPLAASLTMSRIGNYIDFGALDHVSEDTFLDLFHDIGLRPEEKPVYASFLEACEKAESFLLICDNCGEIVLDKLMIEQLRKRFPSIRPTVLVRGGEAMNDVTEEDAHYTGIDRVADIVSNGAAVTGTVYDLLPPEARMLLDGADVIFSKGQGNYESLSGQGRHIFYSFLCKCDLFQRRFKALPLTGMFIEENPDAAEDNY